MVTWWSNKGKDGQKTPVNIGRKMAVLITLTVPVGVAIATKCFNHNWLPVSKHHLETNNVVNLQMKIQKYTYTVHISPLRHAPKPYKLYRDYWDNKTKNRTYARFVKQLQTICLSLISVGQRGTATAHILPVSYSCSSCLCSPDWHNPFNHQIPNHRLVYFTQTTLTHWVHLSRSLTSEHVHCCGVNAKQIFWIPN